MAVVDIVVRTRNRLLYLARALDDILAQEFTDWHLVVVNDGGDPAPVDALISERPALRDRTTTLHLPETVDKSGAGNRGIAAGTAPFVAIHDDDDTWHPAFLTRTVDHLRTTDDVTVWVRTEIIFERHIGNRLVEQGREPFHPKMQEPTYFDLLRFNHMVPISQLSRRQALEDVGGFDASVDMVEDWVLNMHLARTGRFGFLDGEPLAFWHQRPDTTGDAGNSVFVGREAHWLYDRRYRDKLLREYVDTHGPGGLLYLAKYIDERASDLHTRLDRIEARQQEILDRLGGRAGPAARPGRPRWLGGARG